MFPRKPSLVVALLPLYAVVFGLLGLGTGIQIGRRSGSKEPVAKVGDALDRIQERWYGTVSSDVLLDAAVKGMASKLDPYCEYYTAQDYKDFEEQHMKGQFGGVGIVVGSDADTGYMTVETPVEDSPAFAADILPGDQIREVDGASIKDLPLQDVVRKIKGVPGTSVTLTMARKGRDPFKVTLTRQIIVVKAVKPKMLEDGVGYIRISDFTEMMPQFDAAAKDLAGQGMKALVVDLRFNGGGLLRECVFLADRFLDDGLIVTTRGKTPGDVREESAKPGDTLPPYPLVVLVNGSTASASEVFAGAMKDRKRGVLVGEKTFGKGSVQTPFTLEDGSHLKLTTARYFTPNGTSVHREEGKKEYGLEPDFLVEMSNDEYAKLMRVWNNERVAKGEKPAPPEGFKDHQLEAGLEVLRARLQNREPKVEARVLKKDKPSEN